MKTVVLTMSQAYVIINMRWNTNASLKMLSGRKSPYLCLDTQDGNFPAWNPVCLSTLNSLIKKGLLEPSVNTNEQHFFLTWQGKNCDFLVRVS